MAKPISLAIGFCEYCWRKSYRTRKDAMRVAKAHNPHKSAYPCQDPDDFFGHWHVGKVADDVKHGHMTRDEYYR